MREIKEIKKIEVSLKLTVVYVCQSKQEFEEKVNRTVEELSKE